MFGHRSSLVLGGFGVLAVCLAFAIGCTEANRPQDTVQSGEVTNQDEAIKQKTTEVESLREAVKAQEELVQQIKAGVIHVNYDKPSAVGGFLEDNLEKLEKGRELLREKEGDLEALKSLSGRN